MEVKPGITKWGKSYILDLTDEEIAALEREVKGSGGIQDFMRGLQGKVRRVVKTITLTEKDLEEIPHFAFDYGHGGFEERLITTFGRLLGPQLGRD